MYTVHSMPRLFPQSSRRSRPSRGRRALGQGAGAGPRRYAAADLRPSVSRQVRSNGRRRPPPAAAATAPGPSPSTAPPPGIRQLRPALLRPNPSSGGARRQHAVLRPRDTPRDRPSPTTAEGSARATGPPGTLLSLGPATTGSSQMAHCLLCSLHADRDQTFHVNVTHNKLSTFSASRLALPDRVTDLSLTRRRRLAPWFLGGTGALRREGQTGR